MRRVAQETATTTAALEEDISAKEKVQTLPDKVQTLPPPPPNDAGALNVSLRCPRSVQEYPSLMLRVFDICKYMSWPSVVLSCLVWSSGVSLIG